jgi:uncharacterized integral membrane protein (TIGR00697 family)
MLKLSKETKTDLLLALFISAIAAANLLGSKITTIFGISVSVGIFSYPLTFLITDIISEVYDKKKAFNFFLGGFLASLFILFLTFLSLKLPANQRFEMEKEYQAIFSLSLRMLMASNISFLISQLHDIFVFDFLKRKTKGRFLWIRNNLSTIFSQLFDTIIFMFVAFYQISPKFDVAFIVSLIIPYWLLKISMAVLDTPFCYLGVKWLKKKKN